MQIFLPWQLVSNIMIYVCDCHFSSVFVTSIANLGGADSLSLSSLENEASGRGDQPWPRQTTHHRHAPPTSSPRKNFSASNLSVFNYEANR